MTKTRFEHGAEIETVGPDELGEILRRRQELGMPERIWPENAKQLDANGNGTIQLYVIPVDRSFSLHRLVITADGITPVANYTSATGYAELRRNDLMVDFILFTAASGGIPAVGTWNGEAAPHYAQREKVEVKVYNGPANGALLVRGQGTLFPVRPLS